MKTNTTSIIQQVNQSIAGIFLGATLAGNAIADDFSVRGDLLSRVSITANRFNDKPNIRNAHWRARLSPEYKSESIDVGVRAVLEGATIPNLDARLQEDNSGIDNDLGIDRAYARFKLNPVTITLGAQDNPFVQTNPITDPNMGFVGIRADVQVRPDLKVQIMYDAGRLLTEDTSTSLTGAQVIYEKEIGTVKIIGNLGYQHVLELDDEFLQGNHENSKFDIVSAGLSGIIKETPLGLVSFAGEIIKNFAESEQNFGYVMRVKVGDTSKRNGVAVSLIHYSFEANSLLGGLLNRDSPGSNTTNIVGLLEWKATDNATIYLLSGNPRHIVPTSVHDNERQRAIEAGIKIEF
ncbi:MAG: putative porin [Candidatus Woesearchaeota archaeon]|nr:putative porin [Candidatus Woesearchaeota archaeon]